MKRALALLALTACSGGMTGLSAGSDNGGGMLPVVEPDAVSRHIQHVVILVQENRTYDNLFATFPGGDGAKTGKTHAGKVIPLKETNMSDFGFPHDHGAFLTQYDFGKMDGFDLVGKGGAGQFGPAGTRAYQYVYPNQITPYWTLAKNYVLADHMFQTQSSGSYTAHIDLIAAGTEFAPGKSIADFPTGGSPWGCDAPAGSKTALLTLAHWVKGTRDNYFPGQGPAPCITFPTLRDRLDAAHISWKYYVPAIGADPSGSLFNGFDSVQPVRYGPEWQTNISSPEKNVFTDIKNGTLPQVSWVIPDFANSDHAVDQANGPFPIDYGPSWVATVVNAIGRSKYWNTTLIVVTWDDWGGYYDHFPPPQIDYQGTGFRVPMLVISPYVPKGKVAHATYTFGSILKCVEQVWGLKPLNRWDTKPNSICAGAGNVFNFSVPPRKFVPISTKFTKQFFMRQTPSGEPVDTE